jgi:spermidine/putrescine transport system ATP-binding protein
VADFLGETNFIHAEIAGREGDALRLDSPAGGLRSTAFEHAPEKGGVTCSVRPEAIGMLDGQAPPEGSAVIDGSIVETIYLGEMAQHVVELGDGSRVKVFELHPSHSAEENRRVKLVIAPEDVVVLGN